MNIFRPTQLIWYVNSIKKTNIISSRRISEHQSSKLTSCDLALEYFDVSYRNVYSKEWPSVRLGLLCKHKYVAIINNYCSQFDEHVKKFKELGCMDAGARYRRRCEELQPGWQTRSSAMLQEQTEHQETLRKPLRELSDDELSALSEAPLPPVYPPQYRLEGALPSQVISEVPSPARVVPPLAHARPEVQASALHDFVPSNSLLGLEEIVDESQIFDKYHVQSKPGEGPGVTYQEEQGLLTWPEHLTVMAFPRSDVSTFPKPSYDHGVSDHFALDGASLLPVLLLGTRPGDAVLDMCAAPGGKTLALLQTLMPGVLQSNDYSFSRVKRLKSVLKQFYPPDCTLLRSHTVTQLPGEELYYSGAQFDRVLVDAPCLTDRHSLEEPDNNIFKKSRSAERLSMPELQADLLMSALCAVRVGGFVVYSTCTLSPMQNDGVVHLALNRLWDNTSLEFCVVDYSNVLKPFDFMFKFGNEDLGLKYGQVVLPWLPNNYGPMYCAKLVRVK